jgi:hypothetical protein
MGAAGLQGVITLLVQAVARLFDHAPSAIAGFVTFQHQLRLNHSHAEQFGHDFEVGPHTFAALSRRLPRTDCWCSTAATQTYGNKCGTRRIRRGTHFGMHRMHSIWT